MIATAQTAAQYCGRFAPTPSGPLHLGSLLTALASYLDARHHGGRWLLRIDDLDTARCVRGADAQILRQLESHGLEWDGQPYYQSGYRDRYEAGLKQLQEQGLIYACACTRAQLASRSRSGIDGPIYDGHCRTLGLPLDHQALRFRNDEGSLTLVDRIQGGLQRDLARDIGDFVVRRRDGITGYQLACAIDEHTLGITHVVRGADLLGSSFSQLRLMRQLGIAPPQYAHLPVLSDAQGHKLSKQNHAPAIEPEQACWQLWDCLHYLQQTPPESLRGAPVRELIAWGLAHWSPQRIPALLLRPLESPA